jgi:hypothetical protein
MHAEPVHVNIDEVLEAGPLKVSASFKLLMLILIVIGIIAFVGSYVIMGAHHTWSAYFVSLMFFMGLGAGSVVLTAIFQITRARWSPPVRRLAEANSVFLPVAWVLLLFSYFGQDVLYPWATSPRPGVEYWMNSSVVYPRMLLLLGALFGFMLIFVQKSLRGDIAMAADREKDNVHWKEGICAVIRGGFVLTPNSLKSTQNLLSRLAPALIAMYAVFYSFFAFEMVMSMDKSFMSNLFGAFIFAGNVYLAWVFIAMTAMYHAHRSPAYARLFTRAQQWDIAKLSFGFCMVWGYFFFSQFLPIWYGNLPEETQWLIIRTRELPWKTFAYFVFGSCFIVPFITLLSREVKQTPNLYAPICLLIFCGIWMQDYLIIMPQVHPTSVPLASFAAFGDIGIFLGFLGLFGFISQSFLGQLPFAPISSPLSHGANDW